MSGRIPGAEVGDTSVPSQRDSGLYGTISFVARKLEYHCIGGIDELGFFVDAGVGALESRDMDIAQRARCQTESEGIGIRSHVVADVFVGTAERESRALAARIVPGPAIAAARREIA